MPGTLLEAKIAELVESTRYIGRSHNRSEVEPSLSRRTAWFPDPSAPSSASRVEAIAAGSIARADERKTLLVALLIGGCILAGMAADFAPLTVVGASMAVLAGLVSPSIGLATLAFMTPLQPPALLSPFGFHTVLVVAILLGCVYRLPVDRPRLRMGAPAFLLLGWLLYVTLQLISDVILGNRDLQGAFVAGQFKQVLTGAGAVAAACLVLSQRRPYPFLVAGLASAVLAAILAIATFAGLDAGSPLDRLVAQSIVGLRASGPFGNSNYFGLFEATAITAAAGWAIWTRSRWARSLLIAACAVLGVALALSFSRGALIALAAGVVSLAFLRNRLLGAAILGMAIVAVVAWYPTFQELRLGITFGSVGGDAYIALDQSDFERVQAGLAGLQLVASSPLFGVGFGHYHFLSAPIVGDQAVTFSHNWYLQVLAEQGAVGAVLWVLLLLATVVRLRSRPRFPRLVGLAVFVVYVVGSLFAEPPTSFQTSGFALLVLVAALASDWTSLTHGLEDRDTTDPSGAQTKAFQRRETEGRGTYHRRPFNSIAKTAFIAQPNVR